jgi:hypothetical protein
MPLKKLIAGVGEVDMSPQEESEHLASLITPLPLRKLELRRRVVARMKEELDEDSLLEAANPVARQAAVRTRGRQILAQLNSANTDAELDAIDIVTGW